MSENNDIDQIVIKKTQESLGKFIKKPALTEKLLKRPPFRFLFDIVNAVIKETGFFNDLYTKDELNSENIKDRDGKMQFLQKLIDVIKISLNDNEEILKIRPSKIVAGHEVEKTNKLLQAIGKIIEEKIDLSHAIKSIIANTVNDSRQTKTKTTDKTKTTKYVSSIENINKKEISLSSSSKKIVAKSNKVENNEGQIKNDKKSLKTSKENQKLDVFSDKRKAVNQEKDMKISNSKVKEATTVQKGNVAKIKVSTDKNKSKVLTNKKGMNTKDLKKSNLENIEKQIKNENSNIVVEKNLQQETIDVTENEIKQKIRRKSSNSSLVDIKSIDSVKKEIQTVNNENKKQLFNSDIINSRENSSSNHRRSSKSKDDNIERKSSVGKEKSISNDISNNDGISSKTNSQKEQKSSNLMNTNKLENDEQNTIKSASAIKQITASSSSATLTTSASTLEIRRQSKFIREISNNRPKTSLRPPSVRPPSARPGAPKRRDKNVEIILEPNEPIKVAGINIKLDNLSAELEDDGENLVIIENPEQMLHQKSDNYEYQQHNKLLGTAINTQQGHLVQQILETQKKLIQTNKNNAELNSEDLDISTIQKRQNSAKQINSLKDAIQNLTRSINPLGKLMDFIPEDIDSMQLELTMWRDTYLQAEAELKKEKLLTETAVEPLKKQLHQIDANIKECVEMINASRARILINSQKISSLLLDE